MNGRTNILQHSLQAIIGITDVFQFQLDRLLLCIDGPLFLFMPCLDPIHASPKMYGIQAAYITKRGEVTSCHP